MQKLLCVKASRAKVFVCKTVCVNLRVKASVLIASVCNLALSSCHYAGLTEPRSASNANKLASSWPLKQDRKSAQNMAAIERARQ